MRSFLCFILMLLLSVSLRAAERKAPKASAPVKTIDPPVILGAIDPNRRGAVEFTSDPIDLVIRTLARQGKMNVVISPEVRGKVNLRLENNTPKEIIEVVVQSAGCVM